MIEARAGLILFLILLISKCALICGSFKGLKVFSALENDLNVLIECPGVGDNFVSVLWILPEENGLIGAQASFNPDKYSYRASTGQLIIKNVEFSDSGIYRCISEVREKAGGGHKETGAVQLIVKRSYRNLWEEELYGNTVRAGVAGALIAFTFLSLCLVYKCRHKGASYDSYKRSMELGVCPAPPPPPPTQGECEGTLKGHQCSSPYEGSGREMGAVKADLNKPASGMHSTNSSFLRRLSNVRISSREEKLSGSGSEGDGARSEGHKARSEGDGARSEGTSPPISTVSIGVNTDSLKAIPGSTIIYVSCEN